MTENPRPAEKSAYDEGDHYETVNWDQVPDAVEDGPEDQVVELILREYPQFSLSHHRFRGDRTVVIKREGLLEIVRRLKEDKELDFKFLMDVTAADYPDKNPRFEVVYNLYSFKKHLRLRLKVPVGIEDPYVDSLTPLYESANWHEREVMEFFGIKFRHHPDPRKLFLYDEFKGYPLRKDYPYNKRQPLIEYRDIGIESHHYPGMRGSGVDIKKED